MARLFTSSILGVSRLLVFLLVFFNHARPVLGSLYATKPISTTVFTAGRPAQLSWIDDGHAPLLRDMGMVQIDLYAGNETWVCKLGKDIRPLALNTVVFIPARLPASYNLFTLRFTTTRPVQVIYSSNFPILTNPAAILVSTLSPPSSTASSAILSRTSSTQSTFPGTSTKRPQDSVASGSGSWRLNGRSSTTPGVDMERIHFALIFIACPAIFTISLLM